ncbi:DUF1127 domain-containing protein [Roseovarius sp. CAU 1744]|uniref:DUF1127 domain-containing protein n=1 Tax=Roseovarius sp. CAU 1744 TaxID=3140368 RepID=UPI00325BBFD0
MAFATEKHGATSALQIEISAAVYALMTRIADYRAYRRTVAELSKLGNNELADLGLSRSGIIAAASEAVYGTRA